MPSFGMSKFTADWRSALCQARADAWRNRLTTCSATVPYRARENTVQKECQRVSRLEQNGYKALEMTQKRYFHFFVYSMLKIDTPAVWIFSILWFDVVLCLGTLSKQIVKPIPRARA